MADKLIDRLRVRPGTKVDLGGIDTRATFGWDKDEAKAELEEIKTRLDLLQQRLYGEGRRALLLVIQAMDAAGKDGTIRSIFSGLNPAGVTVTSFKAPGGREVEHDYLWRVHEQLPARGDIGVFNRSHYEDVLVVRVKNLVARSVWAKRFGHIVDFERMLHDEGTRVVKIFLHVSRDEQAERFRERLADPEKRWKFRAGDLDDRKLWPKFMAAYTDAIERTTTATAPWYVVPADRNWVRNLLVARILLDHLQSMNPQLPEPEDGLDSIEVV